MEILVDLVILITGFLAGVFMKGEFKLIIKREEPEQEKVIVSQVDPVEMLQALDPELKQWYENLSGGGNS